MMQFTVARDKSVLEGELVYNSADHAFDYIVRPASSPRSAESISTAAIAIGTLQLEIGRADGAVLFPWGYHPQVNWNIGDLPVINASKARLTVLLPTTLLSGASVSFAEARCWETVHDQRTGWIYVGDLPLRSAEQYIEFASGAVASLVGKRLVSLWLHPEFR